MVAGAETEQVFQEGIARQLKPSEANLKGIWPV